MIQNFFTIGNKVFYTPEKKVVEIIEIRQDMIVAKADDNLFYHIAMSDVKRWIMGIPINITNIEKCLGIEMEEDISELPPVDIKEYYDKATHMLRVTFTPYTNRYCPINMYNGLENVPSEREIDGYDIYPIFDGVWCHFDNTSYDTIGSCDLLYIHELQNIISAIDIDIERLKGN